MLHKLLNMIKQFLKILYAILGTILACAQSEASSSLVCHTAYIFEIIQVMFSFSEQFNLELWMSFLLSDKCGMTNRNKTKN